MKIYKLDLSRNYIFSFNFLDKDKNSIKTPKLATLFDLPCHIEVFKTVDNYKTNVKSNDLCQVFWVHDDLISKPGSFSDYKK